MNRHIDIYTGTMTTAIALIKTTHFHKFQSFHIWIHVLVQVKCLYANYVNHIYHAKNAKKYQGYHKNRDLESEC